MADASYTGNDYNAILGRLQDSLLHKQISAEDYLKYRALPNFFFHLTTAYAILRHNGVDVGKADYLTGAKA